MEKASRPIWWTFISSAHAKRILQEMEKFVLFTIQEISCVKYYIKLEEKNYLFLIKSN